MPRRRSALIQSAKTSLAVLGTNLGLGQPKDGVQKTHSWLKKEGLIPHLQGLVDRVSEEGTLKEPARAEARELPPDSPLRNAVNLASICAFNRELAQRVCDLNRRFDLTLIVGGDHSLAMGSVAGSLQSHPQTKVIWVDAHADFNTPETSLSGNVHGMPLSFITGYFQHPETDALTEWMPRLDSASAALIGLRDIDASEMPILQEQGVLYFTAEDVRQQGIEVVMDQVLETLDPAGDCPFHLSFDVDAVDPRWFPCTGTTVAEGLTLDDGVAIVRRVVQTGRAKTFDLVEINPSLGDAPDVATTLASTLQLLGGLG